MSQENMEIFARARMAPMGRKKKKMGHNGAQSIEDSRALQPFR